MGDINSLTPKQRKIYEFICRHIEEQGYPPTIRDIGKAFEIQSPNGVMCHLKALEKKGLIRRGGGQARAIQIDRPAKAVPGLRVLGLVAAGPAIEAVEQEERLDLHELFEGSEHYALRVRGDSMIEDHIEDGDIVVLRKQETAENGERVVASIDGAVTLKRFYQRKDGIWLEPANGQMEPIHVDPAREDVKIIGTLVGVLRRC